MTSPTGSSGPPSVAALVLAAGDSRRMPGKSKLLRDFRGTPVIRVVAGTALRAGLDPVAVCVAPGDEAISRALEGLPVRLVPVPPDRTGRGHSASAGLSWLSSTPCSAALLLLADEPELDVTDIQAVRDAWAAGRGELLRPRFTDRPGHPVLLTRPLFAQAIELAAQTQGDEGLWTRLTGAGISGVEVTVDREAPIDVDSPSDLRAARSRSGR